MQAAQARLAERVRVVGVVSGPDEAVDEDALRLTVQRLGLTYPQVRDRELHLTRRFGVQGTPTVVVLGPDGEVVHRGDGPPTSWEDPSSTDAAWQQRTRTFGAMGTEVVLEAEGADAALLDRALAAAETELRRVEDVMTSWRDSPLTRLNEGAGAGPCPVPAELARMVARALDVAELTDGAFDPTFAGVGRLWDFKRRPARVPSPQQVEAALSRVGWARVRVDLEGSSIDLPTDMALGLGGIAKGYGVDRAMEVLRQYGVEHALVNAGGDLKVLGRKGGRAWRIAVRHPRDDGGVLAMVPLSNTAMVTSGDYERFFVHEGRRYHHILDPRSGYPATGCISATVIAPDAALADALATALSVMGPEQGLAMIESLPRVEALCVDLEGQVHTSAGLADGQDRPNN